MNIDADLWRKRIREDTFAGYHYEMGIAIEREGNAAAAIDAYRRAISIKRDFLGAYARLVALLRASGRADDADGVAREALAIDPHFLAHAHQRFAKDELSQRRYDAAAAELDQALALHPHMSVDPELWEIFHGIGLRKQQTDMAAAEPYFRRALTINPDVPEAHLALGLTLLAQCRFAEARQAFEGAAACKPDDAIIRTHLGLALQAEGRLEESLRVHRAAIARDPGCVSAYCNFGVCFHAAGRLDDATATYARALTINAGDPNVLTYWGTALHAKGHLQEAEAVHRRALDLLPDYSLALSNLALVLQAQGRQAEALDLHKRSADRAGPWLWCFAAFRPWAAAELDTAYRALGRERPPQLR